MLWAAATSHDLPPLMICLLENSLWHIVIYPGHKLVECRELAIFVWQCVHFLRNLWQTLNQPPLPYMGLHLVCSLAVNGIREYSDRPIDHSQCLRDH